MVAFTSCTGGPSSAAWGTLARVEPDTDTVFVGASAAGLASAACLQRAAVPFVLLEQGAQVAGAWCTRYDRLHLHTSKDLSYGEIAIDLSEHGAHAAICVRSPVNVVPRDFLGLPIVAWLLALNLLPLRVADAIGTLVSRIVFGRLEPLGLRRPPYGPMSQIPLRGRPPLPLGRTEPPSHPRPNAPPPPPPVFPPP